MLDFADLVAIPASWLRRVPRSDLRQRASVAARIPTAHGADPLRHYLGREASAVPELPF